MSSEKKPMKIEFAPGCFDSFEGTQEELDAMIADIQAMFEGKSPEELAEMSRPLDEEEWDELPDEVKEQLSRTFTEDEDLPGEFKRRLQ